MMNVVCDTGPLTHLWQIDLWAAFSAFDTIYLPDLVVREVEQHVELDQLRTIAGCTLEMCSVSQAKIDSIRQTTLPLSLTLQTTDLAVLALSHEISPDVVLKDDLTLRRTLEGQEHTPMGSVGLLLYAYKTGLLNQEQLDQAIDRVFVQSTLYLIPTRVKNKTSKSVSYTPIFYNDSGRITGSPIFILTKLYTIRIFLFNVNRKYYILNRKGEIL